MIRKLVGLRIKELREECGMSQEALANNINMSRSYLAGVEAGSRNISMVSFGRITTGLGVSPAEFFDSPFFDKLNDQDACSLLPERIDYYFLGKK